MAVPTAAPSIVTENLTLALIASSDAPLLLLDGDLRVIATSRSFGRAFGVNPDETSGILMFELGDGEWDVPTLRSLLAATASGDATIDAYEMDLRGKSPEPRRLVVKAQQLQYGSGAPVRLLVTVSDVTDARLAEKVKDDLVRDKAMLLREVQHRVANSLQIIASVLLQSARNVRSEETRSHLHDAHNRVMSIATVQKQLAQSSAGEVALAPYFTELCQSLGASMIHDHKKQSIEVKADESIVSADVSVSLGLIVTELVINALKHAFPNGREGRITVDYQSKGPNWTLSVGDNGIGMPAETDRPPSGLGSSIVEALAHQLRARVRVSDGKPGTLVSVAHAQLAAVEDTGGVTRAV
jgi:two-component sensor histidine kinase